MRASRPLALALPPAALAVTGLFHPLQAAEDPVRWTAVHVAGLVLFPLLGTGPWLAARGRGRGIALVVGLLGHLYAAGYTALDVIAGIVNGVLLQRGTALGSVLYPLGNAFGIPAAAALLAATVVALIALRDLPARLLVPAAVLLLAGGASFLTSHIMGWRGVATMVVLAAGWALIGVAQQRRDSTPAAVHLPAAGARATSS